MCGCIGVGVDPEKKLKQKSERICPECGGVMTMVVHDFVPGEIKGFTGSEIDKENRTIKDMRFEYSIVPTEWSYKCDACGKTEPGIMITFAEDEKGQIVCEEFKT